MNLSGNTIGFAFAKNFLKTGNKVIVVGRQENKLLAAKERFLELFTKVCGVSKEEERIELYEWITENFPDVNVLVNHAGIQLEAQKID